MRQTQKGGEEKRKDAAVADADIRNSKEKAKRRRRRARGRLYLESTRLAKANKHLVNRVIYILCVCVS